MPNQPDTSPTPAQIRAGNYKKKHIKFQGLDISIENVKGSKRSGVDKSGSRWECTLPADYGYIKGTVGADKDHLDVYVGPDEKAFMVWVVNQKDLDTDKFDEHKCILGTKTKKEAIELYVNGFSDGKGLDRILSIKSFTMPEFKEWIKDKGNMVKRASTRELLSQYFTKIANTCKNK